jgi:hypothetical protein
MKTIINNAIIKEQKNILDYITDFIISLGIGLRDEKYKDTDIGRSLNKVLTLLSELVTKRKDGNNTSDIDRNTSDIDRNTSDIDRNTSDIKVVNLDNNIIDDTNNVHCDSPMEENERIIGKMDNGNCYYYNIVTNKIREGVAKT